MLNTVCYVMLSSLYSIQAGLYSNITMIYNTGALPSTLYQHQPPTEGVICHNADLGLFNVYRALYAPALHLDWAFHSNTITKGG